MFSFKRNVPCLHDIILNVSCNLILLSLTWEPQPWRAPWVLVPGAHMLLPILCSSFTSTTTALCVLSPKILLLYLKLRMLSLEILFNNQFVYKILWMSLCQDTKAISENEFSSTWIPRRWSLFWHDLLLFTIHLQNVSVTAALLLQTFSTLLLIYIILGQAEVVQFSFKGCWSLHSFAFTVLAQTSITPNWQRSSGMQRHNSGLQHKCFDKMKEEKYILYTSPLGNSNHKSY